MSILSLWLTLNFKCFVVIVIRVYVLTKNFFSFSFLTYIGSSIASNVGTRIQTGGWFVAHVCVTSNTTTELLLTYIDRRFHVKTAFPLTEAYSYCKLECAFQKRTLCWFAVGETVSMRTPTAFLLSLWYKTLAVIVPLKNSTTHF